MPKSNFLRKKNKSGGSADFKRLKAKVGKRAPQAASHTDTSFKSKRVKVSAQSILHDLGDIDAVTARGQGVQELLIQLRHYSPTSKREALAGLKSIVDRHRGFAEVTFSRLAEASLELVVCVDNDVRKGLMAFQESLLACVSARVFSPFANLYLAYVVSAMTSLNKGVRRDSLSLLALLLARFPVAVADRAERLAPNYAALLAADPASKKNSGRSEALQSLVSLFKAVSRRYGVVLRLGCGGGDLRAASLCWKEGSKRNSALMLCPFTARDSAGSASSGGVGGTGGAGGGSAHLGGFGSVDISHVPQIKALSSILPTVLERLREVWIEALEAVPPDIGLMQSVVNVLLEAIASPAWVAAGGKCVKDRDRVGTASSRAATNGPGREVWGSERGNGSSSGDGGGVVAWFSRFVPLVLEVFPVRPLEGELLGEVEEERLRAIQRLNMELCELVVAVGTRPKATAGAAGDTTADSGEGDSSEWLAPVLAHVHEVLRDDVGRRGAAGPRISSVLRVLAAAIQNPTGNSRAFADWTAQRQRLLSAFGDFFESLPARSEAKLLCVKFVYRLTSTLLSGSTVDLTTEDDVDTPREVCRWLRLFPKLLCQWRGEFLANSAEALRALLDVAKHALPEQHPPATTPSMSSRDDVSHGKEAKGKTATAGRAQAAATAGGRGRGRGQEGLWAEASSELLRSIEPKLLVEFFRGKGFLSLPASAQMDAISLLYHLPSVPASLVSALASACSEPATLGKDVRSFVLEVMHHRRRSLSPSAYLGFLVGVLTASVEVKSVCGAKRTTGQRSESIEPGGGSDGKRRRQRSTSDSAGGHANDAKTPQASSSVSPSPPNMWEVVFKRDEVTGAVCNSLAMIGTRGGTLLEALQPTLLQLLRHRSTPRKSGGERVRQGNTQAAAGEGDIDYHSIARSLDEESLAAMLQGQRAAMACVLCCWEGLGVDPCSTSSKGDPAKFNGNAAAKPVPSPLSALEKPVAVACVWAMKTAGTAEAVEMARGPRLLRPVLVLMKRWPALLPIVLTLIVQSTCEVKVASVSGEETALPDGVMVVSKSQSLKPVLICLQAIVRDPKLQRQLRRRHIGVLRESVERLCVELDGSTLKDVVVQLRADVDVLCGGGVEDRMR